MHALNRQRRRDHGHSVAHREIYLTLDASAVAQWRYGYTATAEVRCDVRYVTGNDEILGSQLLDGWRYIAAYNICFDARQLLAHLRQHLLCIPEDTVGVGRMAESADEHQSFALGK